MIYYYLKIAFRTLLQNKKLATINIFGLAIGLAATVLIVLYVSVEFSYDTFHTKADNIYRVESDFYEGDVLTDAWPSASFGYGPAIKEHIAGVKNFARLDIGQTEQIVGYKDEYIRENTVTYADTTFFELFDFKLLEGDRLTMLDNPNTVVISQKVVSKFFKGESAMGKVMTFATKEGIKKCEVTGVIDDFPENSHIKFDYFISYSSLPAWKQNFWYWHTAYTYVQLDKHTDPKTVEKAFPAVAEKYKTKEALKSKIWGISLVPLKDIHLNKWKESERETKGNKITLYALSFIAVIILIIAWSNYVNISIAQSYERITEIAIKKVQGVKKKKLFNQFMFESLLMNVLALILAVVLIVIALSEISNLVDLKLFFLPLKQFRFWAIAMLVFGICVFLSGFYPAFILSSLKPGLLLKGKLRVGKSKIAPLSFLVVLQLGLSLFLIIGTLTIYKQIKFMKTQPLGLNVNQKMILKFPVGTDNMYHKLESFSKELKSRTDVENVSLSGAVPGMDIPIAAANKLKSATDDKNRLFKMLPVDYHYLDTYKINLIAGRFFDEDFGGEKQKIVINKSALKLLEIKNAEEAIGKEVLLEEQSIPFIIVGVTENWHQQGLNNGYTPVIFLLNGVIEWIPANYITISLSTNKIDDFVDITKKIWNTHFKKTSFDYFFGDSFYNEQYIRDKNDGKMLTFFTLLALLVTCMGLYALAALIGNKRTKEVGVRKALGAKTSELVILLSKDFLKLVLIAFLIVLPVAWYLVAEWLKNFAFHISIPWHLFILSGIIILTITLLTVSFQSYRAAIADPVKSLKEE
ncbi:ABC transporter permease [Aquimarina agarilytica]|uniref:ABC transporter permease n=1 Tax=Aquimarina agarilytica TaxID=1087449 RepID=UPI00028996B5|nr:ABC transporter permease [Aquimarina agarilytica]